MDRLMTRSAWTAWGIACWTVLVAAGTAQAQIPPLGPAAPAADTQTEANGTAAAPAVAAPSEEMIESLGSPRATLKTLLDGVNGGDNFGGE